MRNCFILSYKTFLLYRVKIMSILKYIYICRHFRESIYLNVNPLKNIHPRNFPCLLFKWEEKKLQKTKQTKNQNTKNTPSPQKKSYATPSASISFRIGRVLRVGPRFGPERSKRAFYWGACGLSACVARPECRFRSGDFQREKIKKTKWG